MKYRVFQYGLPTPEEVPELNAFLASHRIASTSHHIVQASGGAMLVVVVEYVEGGRAPEGPKAPKVDYRERLSEADFAVFSMLREERKRIGEEEGVPVYNVFNNAQLAEMVEQRVTTEDAMRKIEGVGQARMEKYGSRILAVLLNVGRRGNEGSGQ